MTAALAALVAVLIFLLLIVLAALAAARAGLLTVALKRPAPRTPKETPNG